MILIVEDIKKWENLLVREICDVFPDEEIVVAHSVDDLKKVLTSGHQKFNAVALDGWLGNETTLEFIPTLVEISKVVISTSQDAELREKMISVGCQAGGNKWNFIQILQKLSL